MFYFFQPAQVYDLNDMKHSDIDKSVAKARKARTKVWDNQNRNDYMPPPSDVKGGIVSKDTATSNSTNSNPSSNSGGSNVYNSRDSASRESAYSSCLSREAMQTSNFTGINKNQEWLPAAVVLNTCENEAQNNKHEGVTTRRGSMPNMQENSNPINTCRLSLGKQGTEDPGQRLNHQRTQSVQLVDPNYGDENNR